MKKNTYHSVIYTIIIDGKGKGMKREGERGGRREREGEREELMSIEFQDTK